MRTTTGRRLNRIEGRLREEEARDAPGRCRRIAHRIFEGAVSDGFSGPDAVVALISLGVRQEDIPVLGRLEGVVLRIPTRADHEALRARCGGMPAQIPDYETLRWSIEAYARRVGIAVESENTN
jgi:hypothetical protein